MYDVYLGKMLLPITPDKIITQINGKNETVTLIDEGEISILKEHGLSTVSFNALFSDFKYPFSQYPDGFHRAGYYLDELEKLKSKKKPFQFIITRKIPVNGNKTFKPYNTNLTVSLENYQIIDDARNGFDIEVQINLKQFKDYGTKTFKVEKPSSTAPMVVEPTRPESTSGGGGKKSGGGSKKGGGKSKTYQVVIPGMSRLSITATSVQDAITKAMGSTWTGDVYVDGKTYYVKKGKITTKPSKKTTVPDTVKKAVDKVVKKVKETVDKVTSVVKTITDKVRKPTTPPKKISGALGKLVLKK